MRRRSRSFPLLTALLLGVLWQPAVADASRPSPLDDAEELHYEWRLEGFLGTVARLIFPGRGEGLLSTRPNDRQRLETELEITSKRSEKGEYWLYGAEVEPEDRTTVEVWNSYRYRDKDKQKRADVAGLGVIDFASGIYQLRQDPPTSPRPIRIWSDGKVYPVEVVPGEVRDRRLPGGERVRARVYRFRAIDEPGQGRWKGRLDLWLAEDDVATPVEILVERASIRVRLRLVDRQVSAAR